MYVILPSILIAATILEYECDFGCEFGAGACFRHLLLRKS